MIPNDTLWNISTFSVTVLAPPIIVGIFFLLLRPCQSPQDFVFGKYELHFVVVGLSLAAFVSSPFVLLLPMEILYSGVTWTAALIGFILAALVVAIFHVPPLHYSRATSLYQYVEDRYHSKTLRYCLLVYHIASGVFYCVTIITLITLYSKSIITMVDKWILAACLIALSMVASIAGGQKSAAYVAVLVYCSETVASLFCVSISGLMNEKSWTSNYSIDHLMPNWSPSNVWDLNLWSVTAGSFVFFLTFFSSTQTAHQHYCSLQTKRRVRLSLLICTIGFGLTWLLLCAFGLLLWQYYAENIQCTAAAAAAAAAASSLSVNQQSKMPSTFFDLIKTFYANSVFPVPGFAGYLIGSLVAIGYATLPAAMTSLSACTWEDLVKPYCMNAAKERRHVTILRLLVVVYAALISVTSFVVVELIDDVWLYLKNALLLISALTSPIGALFLMAVWVPCTNKIGVLIGWTLGVLFSLAMSIGHLFYTPQSYDLTISSTNGHRLCCTNDKGWLTLIMDDPFNDNSNNSSQRSSLSYSNPFCIEDALGRFSKQEDIFPLFRTPLIFDILLSFALTFVSGVLFSFLAGGQDIYSIDWNLVYFTCNELTAKCQCLKFESKKRRRRSRLGLAYATSDSFRYSRQGPFPDNSYHNPNVQTYLDTLSRK